MKFSILAVTAALTLINAPAFAQSEIATPGLNGATLGKSAPGSTAGVPYPNSTAGVHGNDTDDRAMPGGNANNSDRVRPAPHRRIRSGQRHKHNRP